MGDGEDHLIYKPVKVNTRHYRVEPSGAKVSWGYVFKKGMCIFFKNGGCAIHPVKPFECRHAMPCQEKTNQHWSGGQRNEWFATQWNEKA